MFRLRGGNSGCPSIVLWRIRVQPFREKPYRFDSACSQRPKVTTQRPASVIECIQKVFTELNVFLIFPCYSLIPKNSTHNTPLYLKNVFNNLKFYIFLIFLSLSLQVWNSCFWAVSPVLPCKTSKAPSGWLDGVSAQLFLYIYNQVQFWALAGPFKDIHRVGLKPLFHLFPITYVHTCFIFSFYS